MEIIKLKNRLSEMNSWAEQKLDPHIRYHLIFDIEAKVNQWRKKGLSNKWC